MTWIIAPLISTKDAALWLVMVAGGAAAAAYTQYLARRFRTHRRPSFARERRKEATFPAAKRGQPSSTKSPTAHTPIATQMLPARHHLVLIESGEHLQLFARGKFAPRLLLSVPRRLLESKEAASFFAEGERLDRLKESEAPRSAP